MQYMAMTADKLRDDLKEPAVTQIKQQLALDGRGGCRRHHHQRRGSDEEVKRLRPTSMSPTSR